MSRASASDDLYERLGVERGASVEEIRRAYKELARENHPDRGGKEEDFKRIQEAHEVLSDEERRRMYDMTGQTAEGSGGGFDGMAAGGFPFSFMSGAGPFGMPGVAFSMGDVFGQMFGGGGSGGGGRRRGPRAARGPNKFHDIPLTLADFFKGREIKLKFNQARRCATCAGSGAEKSEACSVCRGTGVKEVTRMLGPGIMARGEVQCDDCHGEGKRVLKTCAECRGKRFVEREKQLDIRITPGMRDGEQLTFAGECSDSLEFEEPGDVVLTLRRSDAGVGEIDEFEWNGDDLWIRKSVTFSESLLGFVLELKDHPSGRRTFEWRGGPLVHGAVLKFVGGGMPKKTGGHGILYIQIFVTPPEVRPWTPEEAAKLLSVVGGAATSMTESSSTPLTLHSAEPRLRVESP